MNDIFFKNTKFNFSSSIKSIRINWQICFTKQSLLCIYVHIKIELCIIRINKKLSESFISYYRFGRGNLLFSVYSLNHVLECEVRDILAVESSVIVSFVIIMRTRREYTYHCIRCKSDCCTGYKSTFCFILKKQENFS